MIQMQTVLEAADNSGAKNLRCIKVLGGSKKRYARVGDIIVASIKDSIPNSRVKAGDVVKAVIVRTKKEFRRQDGTYIKFCLLYTSPSPRDRTRSRMPSSA